MLNVGTTSFLCVKMASRCGRFFEDIKKMVPQKQNCKNPVALHQLEMSIDTNTSKCAYVHAKVSFQIDEIQILALGDDGTSVFPMIGRICSSRNIALLR